MVYHLLLVQKVLPSIRSKGKFVLNKANYGFLLLRNALIIDSEVYTSIYIKSFHTTGVYLGCRGFNMLRFIYCTLEMKIEIILGSTFPQFQ